MDAVLSRSKQLQNQGGFEGGNSDTIRKNIVQDYDTIEDADSDDDAGSDRYTDYKEEYSTLPIIRTPEIWPPL